MKLRSWHGLVSAACLPRTLVVLIVLALLLPCAFVSAQEPPKPPVISPHARLMAARSIFIERSGGRIPNDVIGDAFQGWGRYELAPDAASADLIVSIIAPLSNANVSVSSGDHSKTVASADVTQISLRILDAHDRAVLWSGSEQPKSAMHEKKSEDNLVDASLRLFRRFRNTIEPELAP
jgi:hypothetical protein